MIQVINTIQCAPGYGDALVERLRTPRVVHESPGFVRLELTRLSEAGEHEQYQVITVWESREAFDSWAQTRVLPKTQRKRGSVNKDERVIGNKVTIREVLVHYDPALVDKAD
ncbi:MAG: isdG [Paenibacillus sp.]|nr:isdG [Paenibacillus sp.]